MNPSPPIPSDGSRFYFSTYGGPWPPDSNGSYGNRWGTASLQEPRTMTLHNEEYIYDVGDGHDWYTSTQQTGPITPGIRPGTTDCAP